MYVQPSIGECSPKGVFDKVPEGWMPTCERRCCQREKAIIANDLLSYKPVSSPLCKRLEDQILSVKDRAFGGKG